MTYRCRIHSKNDEYTTVQTAPTAAQKMASEREFTGYGAYTNSNCLQLPSDKKSAASFGLISLAFASVGRALPNRLAPLKRPR